MKAITDTEIKNVRKALPKIKTLKNSQQFKKFGGHQAINTVVQPNEFYTRTTLPD